MHDPEPAAPSGDLRRDLRPQVDAAGLPAAPPIQSAHPAGATAGMTRSRRGWILAIGVAVALVGGLSIAGGVLALSGQSEAPNAVAEADLRTVDQLTSAPCRALASTELGSSGGAGMCADTDDSDVDDRESADPEEQPAPPTGQPTPPSGSPVTDPQVPTDRAPGAPTPSAPPTTPVPANPVPSAPPASTPPAPAPKPPAPKPPAPSTPPVVTVQPLAFTGVKDNYTLGLLGIRILGSYTLSLSGEPGSTVSVTYDSAYAGAVTFDGNGRASITLGQSLLSLGPSNPLIQAAYSDGTAGAAIQAYLNSI